MDSTKSVSEPRASHGDPRLSITPTREDQTEREGFTKFIYRVFNWHPRTHQSRQLIVVPVAMLEEARDSLPCGDARGCLEIMLKDGIRI